MAEPAANDLCLHSRFVINYGITQSSDRIYCSAGINRYSLRMVLATNKSRIVGRELKLLIGLIISIGGMWAISSQIYKEVGTRRIEVMTVEVIDVPRTCVSRRSGGIFGIFSASPHRSSAPTQAIGTGLYCGHIATEYGTFKLPESNTWAIWDDSREQMFDRLKVGCRYETVVVGHYRGFENMFPIQNRLSRIVTEKGCK